MKTTVHLALFRSRSLISRAIRWQTRGDYSHAALLFADNLFVEAREFIGVRSVSGLQRNPGEHVDLFPIELTLEQEGRMRAFLYRELGCGYDWRAILAFVTRTHVGRASAHRWFCSELVYAAFRLAGIDLFRATLPSEVSPGLLARSPLLPSCPARSLPPK